MFTTAIDIDTNDIDATHVQQTSLYKFTCQHQQYEIYIIDFQLTIQANIHTTDFYTTNVQLMSLLAFMD